MPGLPFGCSTQWARNGESAQAARPGWITPSFRQQPQCWASSAAIFPIFFPDLRVMEVEALAVMAESME